MHASSGQPSAKIYQFQARTTSRRTIPSAEIKSGDLRSLQIAKGAFEGAWYHDAEIQEALRASKR